MTLEQLRIFVAVAETLNMRAAAERLHLTQPAVSAAIAALEERHATRLFDRVGRGLELNDAGRAFLPEARGAGAGGRCAGRAGRSGRAEAGRSAHRRQPDGRDVLAAPPHGRLAAAHPGVTLHLEVGNTAQAVAALLAGAADLGFVEGGVDEDILAVERIGGDRLALYAAPAHPLAGRPLAREDIAAACWCCASRDRARATTWSTACTRGSA
jgi:DNA-binding transcriptional LysR family regulator